MSLHWDRLIAKHPLILQTVEKMPVYLLKPEVLGLLAAEKHPIYRLILDLMWTTGARISEILALTPSSFIEDGHGYGVVLTTLKQRPGRLTPAGSDPKLSLRKQVSEVRKGLCDDAADSASAAARAAAEGGESVAGASLR